jgi:DNA-binding transcriptional LysR family regulator
MDRPEQTSRRLRLRHLDVLLTVAKWGSMAKAAEHLSITQPVVSKAIADLEGILGVPVLDRRPQGVEPTLYGRALIKRSHTIFDELRTSVSEIGFLADPTVGELRVGSTESVGAGLVRAVVSRLGKRYPRIIFEIVLGASPSLLARELRGRQVELVAMATATDDLDDDLQATILYHDRLHVIAGLESPWARRRNIALSDLLNERWCLPPPDHPVTIQVAETFHRSGLPPPKASVIAASHHFVVDMVADGQCLGALWAARLRSYRGRLPLKILPVEFLSPVAPVRIVTLKDRTLSPLASLFIDTACDVAKPLTVTK